MSQILILVRPVYALLVLRYLGGCSLRGAEAKKKEIFSAPQSESLTFAKIFTTDCTDENGKALISV